MQFHILTIFPEMFQGFLNESILKKAQGNGHITIQIHDIRDYTEDKHKKVDDEPYGGGAGMVFTPQPLFDCINAVKDIVPEAPVIYMSPRGRVLSQESAERMKIEYNEFILVCGHYEGIDQRVIDALVDFELSIGEYVLSGGEIPAMVFTDVMARLHEGVLGNAASHQEESFSEKLDRKKEYPHYTRPADFRGMKVPDVLMSGNHAEIEKWRRDNLS